jgi:hypothetical protein
MREDCCCVIDPTRGNTMRKFTVTAALLGLAVLGVAVPAAGAQAAERTAGGTGCDSKWGARNGNVYAWDAYDCQGGPLIVTPGDNPRWADSAYDKASSVMNRGCIGGRDHVKFYEYFSYYGGGHACLAPGELYADNLSNDRFTGNTQTGDHIVDNCIMSHKWVTRSECGTLLT